MMPFQNFTTKAKDAVRKAHELAIERGQNHVNPLHLFTALVLQDESTVFSILDRMEIDTVLLTDSLVEALEAPETSSVLSPSYQLYLTPELAQVLENAGKIATGMQEQFVNTEHLFLTCTRNHSTIRL
jgi:ATP-dependent Clp protease ATP-binding subunit ClpA